MSVILLVGLVCCVLAWRLSRAPGVAYLLYYLAFLPFLTLDPEAGGAESVADFARSGSAIKAALRAITALGFVVLLVRRRGWFTRLTAQANWPVLLFVLWAAASLSRAPSPLLAGVRLGELFSFFLAGLCLHAEVDRHHGPREVLRWRCAALLPVCLMTLIAAILQPDLMALHQGSSGLRLGHRFLEANVLGFSAGVLSLWATFALREPRPHTGSYLRERGMTWFLLALGLTVLFFARSRTAMIAWVVGQGVLWFWFGRGDLRRQLAAVVLVCLVGLGIVLGSDLAADWILRGASVADLASATGRTDLWAALVREEVAHNPLFGAGYMALGSEGRFYFEGRSWNNAHSTYLFALVSTGLPGLVLLLAVTWVPLSACVRRAVRGGRLDRAWAMLFALQVTVLITGVTGFGICGYPNVVMLFSFAMYSYCTGASVPAVRYLRGPARVHRSVLQDCR